MFLDDVLSDVVMKLFVILYYGTRLNYCNVPKIYIKKFMSLYWHAHARLIFQNNDFKDFAALHFFKVLWEVGNKDVDGFPKL